MISADTFCEPTPTLAGLICAKKERQARFEAAVASQQEKLAALQRKKDREEQIKAFEFAMANMPRKPKFVPLPEVTIDLPKVVPNLRLDIRTIQAAVAKRFEIGRMELLSRTNLKRIAEPRQIAMYLSKRLTDHSLPQIGRKFGWRDHTTVIHAINKIDKLVQADTPLGRIVTEIRAELLA